MESENFFETIGKKIPYEVPDGFFDSITERTLNSAKERNRQVKNKRYMVIWTSAAAVILVLLTISVLYNDLFNKIGIEETLVEAEENNGGIIPGEKSEPISDSSLFYEMMPGNNELITHPEENPVNGEEEFKELLATLTEDELVTLAGQITAEISISSLTEE